MKEGEGKNRREHAKPRVEKEGRERGGKEEGKKEKERERERNNCRDVENH